MCIRDREQAAARIESRIRPYLPGWVNHRWVALRLLEGDMSIIKAIIDHLGNGSEQLLLQEGSAVWAR